MRAKIVTMNIRGLLLLLVLPLIAISCAKDDDDGSSSNGYCYIKSVTLGNIQRQVGDLSTTFSGSYYEMTINLREGTIENCDSLPYGSLLSSVAANITFEGSSLQYRAKYGDGQWTSYNSTDSLNLTQPLELYLTSGDSKSSRTYTLKVNVHKQEGDSIYWKQCEEIGTEHITGLTDMKAFVKNDKLMVLGKKGTDFLLAERSGLDARGSWKETAVTGLPSGADPQTLRQHEGTFYLSAASGEIFSSTNATDWQQTGTTLSAGLTLIEKTDKFFYAISESKLLRSADASTWEEDKLDSETSLLPTANIRALTVKQANGSRRIVMVGQKDSETKHDVVWNKMWNDGWKSYEEDATWIYFLVTPDNIVPCPNLQYFNLLAYDGKCIAFGGASADGKHVALDVMHVSQDYGLTWRPSGLIRMPSALRGVEGCIASTVDENNFIWIITNSQVWRGRLNKLGFAQR